jgi:class 3 adenylate cyclase
MAPITTWRGRKLKDPGEPIFDRGLAFDLETLLDRRGLLKVVGIGGLGLALAACSASPSSGAAAASSSTAGTPDESCVTIPEETAGQYPGDGSNGPDVLSESGIVRRDIRSSFGDVSGTAEGVPLEIQLHLEDASTCAPLAGAAVYLWHCDREGHYSLYTVTDQNYLRGVQEADDGDAAVTLAAELQPDVVLMDIRMPGVDGLEATRRIVADDRLDRTRILILTTFDLDEYVFEALRLGASGFLLKDTEPQELVQGVRTIARGDALLSPRVTRQVIGAIADRDEPATLPSPSGADRVLATVMFSDIVSSTERAAAIGDLRWREVLDRHDALIRAELARHGGREVKTTGDGFLALFDAPARAIRCAVAIRDRLRAQGVEVRIGLHAGEVQLRGDDVGGIAVHIGSRVLAAAEPGDVVTSSTVKDLVAGSGIGFVDRGEHDLRGVPDRWRLFAVRTEQASA